MWRAIKAAYMMANNNTQLIAREPLRFKYNSKVNSESVDILANYVASSFLWFKCYGTLCARGNTKKNPVTKPQKTIKFHKAKIQGFMMKPSMQNLLQRR
jgi:hypothetical protein